MRRGLLGRLRVRDKLFVVVLAPLLLFSVLAVQVASDGFSRAAEASDARKSIEFATELTDLGRSIVAEEAWLIGPRQVDREDLGSLMQQVGLSEQFFADYQVLNQTRTDASVVEMLAGLNRHSNILLPAEVQFLNRIQGELEQVRAQYEQASRSTTQQSYRRLSRGVTSILERLMRLDETGLGRSLIDLGRVEVAASQEAVNLLATLSHGVYSLEADREIAAAQIEQDRALRAMRNGSAEVARILAPVNADGVPEPGVYAGWIPYRLMYGEVTPEGVPRVFEGGEVVVAVVAAQRLSEDLVDVESQIIELMAQRAQVAESKATRDALLTLGLVLPISLVSLVLALVVARSVTRPLELVVAGAARLREGKLDGPDLGIGGSDEIAVLGEVVDSTVGTFGLLGRQIAALAVGDVDAEVLQEHLPGDIGRSVQESVASLATVTMRLRSSETLATTIVNTAADAILLIDDQGFTRRANKAAVVLTCRTEEQLLGVELWHCLSDIPNPGAKAIESTLLRPDGSALPVLVSVGDATTEEGAFRTVIVRDISVQKLLEAELTRDARHDPLTGLVNRLGLLELVFEMQKSGESFAVFFIDLNRFKRVNDTLGHQSGDDLLLQIANRIRSCMREQAIVARVGGDEFVVVAEIPGSEVAFKRGEQLVETISQPVRLGRRTAFVGASVGIVFQPSGTITDPETLIQHADMAMYDAKHCTNTDVEVFDQVLQQRIADRDQMERDLRDVIAEDLLEVHYQPIVSLESGNQVGVEALARWNRDGEWINPEEFIVLAENTDLIFGLWERVIGKVCESLAAWQQIDPGFKVSVNVSARQFNTIGLIDSVRVVIAAYDVDPSGLRLEITETSVLQDIEDVGSTVDTLREMGIGVALDDFGAGYSSLTSLLALDLDAVKIDKSFVMDLHPDTQQAEIVRIILMLAETVGIDVIAEGVETHAQSRLLSSLGCELGQGWLFSKARPFEEIIVGDELQHWQRQGSHAAIET